MGKNGRIFSFIKFRTMGRLAEHQKGHLLHLNEADGPVFKIRNDPRYTQIGKFLAHAGLDELPQLINVLNGDMSIVGPRPLPISEARKIPKKCRIRESIKPGMTSSWVIKGSHLLSFEEWMKLDKDYVHNASINKDIRIILKTLTTVLLVTIFRKIFKVCE
jgi:lipopolysaccharide/colanic/teichoic acid biosynthesis glycosyltransferase